MRTEEIYELVEQTRRTLGMTQQDVGMRAFGKPDNSAIQNLRRGKSPSLDTLTSILGALGMKLDISKLGTTGALEESGFSEHSGLSGSVYVDFEHSADAYAPLPFYEQSGRDGPSPIAVSKVHLSKHNFSANQLVVVKSLSNDDIPNLSEGDLVVVDLSEKGPLDGQAFCYFQKALDRARFGYLKKLRTGSVVAMSGPLMEIEEFPSENSILLAGRVVAVWSQDV